MLPQIVIQPKVSPTARVGTGERLLARVDHHVPLQLRRLGEGLRAALLGARVLLFAVDALVLLERAGVRVHLFADAAAVLRLVLAALALPLFAAFAPRDPAVRQAALHILLL